MPDGFYFKCFPGSTRAFVFLLGNLPKCGLSEISKLSQSVPFCWPYSLVERRVTWRARSPESAGKVADDAAKTRGRRRWAGDRTGCCCLHVLFGVCSSVILSWFVPPQNFKMSSWKSSSLFRNLSSRFERFLITTQIFDAGNVQKCLNYWQNTETPRLISLNLVFISKDSWKIVM